MSTGNSTGKAENASVDTDVSTKERDNLLTLADEADKAADDILTKLAGMEATRKAKLAEAKEYRSQAKKLEN